MQQALEVRPRRDKERIMTMVLEGEIGLTEMADVSEMLFRLMVDDVKRIIIDMSGVTHFDYRGVKHLIRHADSFRMLSGDLKLAGLSPYLHAIFKSAGGVDAFDYFATSQDAKASYLRAVFVQGG
jgi:anti-sigma B factor antagonist